MRIYSRQNVNFWKLPIFRANGLVEKSGFFENLHYGANEFAQLLVVTAVDFLVDKVDKFFQNIDVEPLVRSWRSWIILNLVHSCSFLFIPVHSWFFFSFTDLSTVDKKVNNGDYTKLCEFIGDVMRIFENCRFFNQPNSSIMKSAESLENFFSQKLSHLRERVKP